MFRLLLDYQLPISGNVIGNRNYQLLILSNRSGSSQKDCGRHERSPRALLEGKDRSRDALEKAIASNVRSNFHPLEPDFPYRMTHLVGENLLLT